MQKYNTYLEGYFFSISKFVKIRFKSIYYFYFYLVVKMKKNLHINIKFQKFK
jgi:hypothetical protein